MMNNFIGLDTRNRRNLNTTFPPIHVPVSNYSTKVQTKESMNDTYNTMFLNNLHLIPDPLKKNLADSVITEKDISMTKTKEYTPKEVEKPPSSQTSDFYPRLRNIISGVLNVMGAMFQRRDSSPASQYYDCFEGDYIENSDEPMTGPVPWQSASCDVQNKNSWAQSIFDDNNETNWSSEMMSNCSPALTDDQINQVCLLLNSESNYIQIPNSKSKPFESGSVDVFEDAFCPDELSISTESYLEYHSPLCYQEELFNSYASNKSKLNKENTDSQLVKETSPKPEEDKLDSDARFDTVTELTPKQNRSGDVLTDSAAEMSPKQEDSDTALSSTHPSDVNKSIEIPNLAPASLQLSETTTNTDMVSEDSSIFPTHHTISTIQDNVSSCEDKMNRLKALLKSKCKPKETKNNDNNLCTDNTAENIVCDTSSGVVSNVNKNTDNPDLVTDASPVLELNETITKPDMVSEVSPVSETISTISNNVVSTCEDKLNRLKALLKSKCKPKETENVDNIGVDNTSENIVSDTVFGGEICLPGTSCLRLAEPFNEVTGKFYSSSVESDDSFQIVFTDDTKEARCRIPSECESEDSFIVFEESPDSCYISDDVFGNVQLNHCYSDSETSDSEDDSGCESRLCPSYSRTVEDLTDSKLYDEVDSSTIIGQHIGCETLQNEDTKTNNKTPHRKVHFSSEPPKVHVMRVWAFAARQARIGEWEQHARDRERFKSRINDVEMAISWVLKPQHRRLVMFQRFMPWWNAQKRKEQEEKKQQELEQQMKQQQEEKNVENKEEKLKLNNNENIKNNVINENTLTEEEKQTNEERLPKATSTEHEELKDKTDSTDHTEEVDKGIQAEDKAKLDINEKKAPDRANGQGTELDDNIQLGNEVKMTNSCDDVNEHTDPSLGSDR